MIKQIDNRGPLFILSAAAFLSVLDIFIVNVALPTIKKDISATEADIQMVIAGYLLGYAVFLITGARAGDYYGKKRVYVISMCCFTLTSLFCGIAQTPMQLNISRSLQGISAAFMVPQSLAYIQLLFPDQAARVKALGFYGSVAGIASVIGQFLGGFLPEVHFSNVLFAHMDGWRLIFLINIPLGIAAATTAYLYLKESKVAPTGKFDFSGVALLSLALLFLVYPLIRGRELGWPLWSVGLLVSSFLLLYGFVKHQQAKMKRGLSTLINVYLFRYPDFKMGLFIALFYFIAQDSYFLITGLLLQDGLNVSSSETGLLFVFQGIGYVLGAVISVHLIGKYGRKIIQLAVLLMMGSLVLHGILFSVSGLDWYLSYPLLLMYGVGCGSVLPSIMSLALQRIPGDLAGSASGLYSTVQQAAIALGIGITGGVFFSFLEEQTNKAAFVNAYIGATGVNILALGAVLFFLYRLPKELKPELLPEKA
ncbi:MFS transporter [Pedobacter gandavensis]|uniref:MFS transporter n=1 Tax=Pedobacter gandavensis TaxID=2679963 RepID=A0ABR6ETJ8_9SPHI|nr:MFS transporter [Pedobacter gandavensis]MBB2148593.1 MFS transporter [Pedobacter gandavensis]